MNLPAHKDPERISPWLLTPRQAAIMDQLASGLPHKSISVPSPVAPGATLSIAAIEIEVARAKLLIDPPPPQAVAAAKRRVCPASRTRAIVLWALWRATQPPASCPNAGNVSTDEPCAKCGVRWESGRARPCEQACAVLRRLQGLSQ